MKRSLELSGLEPSFWGTNRCIYIHPDDPDLLIKVPRKEAIERAKQIPNWKRRFKPLGAGSINFHEMRESMRLHPSAIGRLPHLFTTVGLIQTSMGWGLIVEAERDRAGNYAPTLAAIARETERYQKSLEKFMHWLETTPAVFYDLNPWNLVLSFRDGQDEIVVIDGVGEKSALQSRTYFQSMNRKKNRKAGLSFYRFLERIKSGEIIV